ncbi:MAG: septum site-determining protein MinD [Clostridia bacterium]|nr:septum site-determining protein MinD [Clostridia bacterium]
MGEKIVITSGKGGVGKSTIAANLAAAFARLGKNSILVDMDMGLRSLDVFLGLENKVVFDLSDLADGICREKQALVKWDVSPRVRLVAAAQLRGSETVDEDRLTRVLDSLKEDCDYLLIDCPAGVGRGFRNATASADTAILVATPDGVCLRDAERMAGLLKSRDIPRLLLAVNRVSPRHLKPDWPASPGVFAEKLGLETIALIPEDACVERCTQCGVPAAWQKGSRAGRAIMDAARRLNGESVPQISLNREFPVLRLLRRLGLR